MGHESEIAVLSILLKNDDKFIEFPVEFFSSEVNQNIYKILQQIKQDQKEIDTHLVRLIAERDNINIGGDDYLDVLLASSYSPANLEDYLYDLEVAYKNRRLYDLSLYIRDSLHDGNPVDDIAEIITKELKTILSLGNTSSQSLSEGAIDFALKIAEEAETGELPGLSTGFQSIDLVTSGIRGGNLWIIAGRPGMGKSAWMQNSVRNTDYNKAVYSLEMGKSEFLEREFALGSGISLLKIRARSLTKPEVNKIIEAANKFNSRKDILLSTDVYGLSALERNIRLNVKNDGVKVVHVDYVQLLAERDAEATHALGRISRKLKQLARELDIGIILYSQLNRNVELRDDKRPLLSDIRQSGNLEEDPDLVGFLYRDEYYHKDTKDKGVVEFIIAKQRNGPTGTIFLKFDKETVRIYEE